jgi:hypothetical protein
LAKASKTAERGQQELIATSQASSNRTGATQRFAEFVVRTAAESITKPTLTSIEDCLLDFVSIGAYAGRFAESSASFREGARPLAARKERSLKRLVTSLSA